MINVAIDGPAGAGKSSIARKVAGKLGYIYVDTGALYRTVALKVARCSLEASEVEKIEQLLATTVVGIEFVNGEQRMMLDGEDVTGSIRTPEVSMLASAVSAIPAVRAYLLSTQRRLAAENIPGNGVRVIGVHELCRAAAALGNIHFRDIGVGHSVNNYILSHVLFSLRYRQNRAVPTYFAIV